MTKTITELTGPMTSYTTKKKYIRAPVTNKSHEQRSDKLIDTHSLLQKKMIVRMVEMKITLSLIMTEK